MKAKFFLLVMVAVVTPVWADPCGLVPPISTQDDPARYLQRTGDQLTYVFFKDGIEDVCLRPAFKGKVSEFGMLIPFPSAPAIRKVSDDIFYQVKNAIEPPKVEIDLNMYPGRRVFRGKSSGKPKSDATDQEELKYNEVSDEVFAQTLLNAKILASSAKSESTRSASERSVFKLENLRVGMVAPDIVGDDLGGGGCKLSEYRGKVVVIDFWGDW